MAFAKKHYVSVLITSNLTSVKKMFVNAKQNT